MLQTHQGHMLLKCPQEANKEGTVLIQSNRQETIPQTESMETPCRPVIRSQTGTIIHPPDRLRF